MRTAALLTILCATASAQTTLPPELGSQLFARTGLGVLKCQVQPLRPVLDFSLRFHAGYTVRVPLTQYKGPGHKWTVTLRIQPELVGDAVYLADSLNLPDVSQTDIDGEAGGGYLLGEGYYRASLLLVDDQERACRAEWNIEARPGAADVRVKIAIAPGAIQEISLRSARSVNSQAGPTVGKLTVLLHAAPVIPSRSKINAGDAVTLLGALSSLLDLAPAQSVRLVVFNLEQQKEIYRQENFTLDRLEAVRQAMFDLQLALVDVQTLQRQASQQDILTSLVNQELQAENRSDVVVFLGPHARSIAKPASPPQSSGAGPPKFFYVEYQRSDMYGPVFGQPLPRVRPGATMSGLPDASTPDGSTPTGGRGGGFGRGGALNGGTLPTYDPFPAVPPRDTIDYLVAALKGKTLVVRTPADFAAAMKQVAPKKGK